MAHRCCTFGGPRVETLAGADAGAQAAFDVLEARDPVVLREVLPKEGATGDGDVDYRPEPGTGVFVREDNSCPPWSRRNGGYSSVISAP